MKQEESQILKKIGKEAGFKVPDGYFEQFNQRMAEMLPEVEITEVEATPSLWMRIRPYVYMAAMFAGVWCMMEIFSHFNGTSDLNQRVANMGSEISVGDNADQMIMNGVVSDYDLIMNYQDSIEMTAAQDDDTSNP